MPIETKGLIEGEKNKQVYRIRNRRLGMIYVALSHHASQRLEERNLNSMQLLGTLKLNNMFQLVIQFPPIIIWQMLIIQQVQEQEMDMPK